MKRFGTITIAMALGLGISLTGFADSASAATNNQSCQLPSNFKQMLPFPAQWQAQLQQNPALQQKLPFIIIPGQQQQPVQQQPVQQKPVQQAPVQNPAPANNQVQQPATPAVEQGQQSDQASAFTKQVADLVNQERAKAGLAPLQFDAALSKVAQAKAADMAQNNYFDHNSPTYGSPFDMMKQFGISYSTAGENIAMGQRTPQEVMTQWMNSEGHRQNIMNGSFTKIGVGFVNGYWVQSFIG
jgi:uncharacterized YkwD family protein